MIRFYYLDEQYPNFGSYYCYKCSVQAGMSYEMSWLSTKKECDSCGTNG